MAKILIKILIALALISSCFLAVMSMHPVLIVLGYFLGSGVFYAADMAGDWVYNRYYQWKVAQEPEPAPHEHIWELKYYTGNANEGKSEVSKCKCGQWGVRHYGQADHILLNKPSTGGLSHTNH